MSGTSHSPLATVLLLVPIVTVPLLAIFGVPQIMPLPPKTTEHRKEARKTETDAPEFVPGPAPGPARNWPDFAEAPARTPDAIENPWPDEVLSDPTARALADRRAEAQKRIEARDSRAVVMPVNHATTDPIDDRLAAASHTEQSMAYVRQPQPGSSSQKSRPRNGSGMAAVPPETLTWQSAVRRLNELEIRNYRLEPGQKPEHFMFICSYTPTDNPRVSYRFEAEADEPLRAVEKVLTQIDAWLASR